MNTSITELADKIAKLEKQLYDELDKQQEKFSYQFEGSRIRFEQEVEQAHRKF